MPTSIQGTLFKKFGFFEHAEIQENAIRELRAYHRKCVPGSIETMEEMLGTVYRQ